MANLFSRLTNAKVKNEHNQNPSLQSVPNEINAFMRNISLANGQEMLTGKYKPFDNIDTEALINNIEIFRHTDIKAVSDSDLSQILYNIVQENLLQTYDLSEGTNLYRARSKSFKVGELEDVFESFDDLWYAKPKFLKKMGRLNNIGQPLLYASFDALTPIHEIRNERDAQFALMKYKIKTNQKLSLAMIAVEDHVSIANRMKAKFNWTDKAKQNWKIINDFLRAEFTKKVAHGKEYLYKTTIEITRQFDFPGCDGFLYPSIERPDGYNVAIKPDSADRALEFVGLSYWKNMHYDNISVNRDDFRCWQKWSDTIQNGKIVYAPISPCKIDFPRLRIDASVTYYDDKLLAKKNPK